ncbi:hypothetical protein Scep_027278 [Stephania cephalantha]|uniref:Transcriptional elongation regulator MINIYO n=1 Tax=Stephania cephalantha TaxID=152367 RepID=A0AAP0E7V5_9MAGN
MDPTFDPDLTRGTSQIFGPLHKARLKSPEHMEYVPIDRRSRRLWNQVAAKEGDFRRSGQLSEAEQNRANTQNTRKSSPMADSPSPSPSPHKLVGAIVEKKKSVNVQQQQRPPRPSLLPFPVARHRSHGPHWTPLVEDDGSDDEDDDRYEPYLGRIVESVAPIQRKPKKGLDFSRWRELVNVDDELSSRVSKLEAPLMTTVKKPEIRVFEASRVVDEFDSTRVVDEECSRLGNIPESFGSIETQIDAENRAVLERMSTGEIAEAQDEIRERLRPELLEMLRKRAQKKQQQQSSGGMRVRDVGESAEQTNQNHGLNRIAASSDVPMSKGDNGGIPPQVSAAPVASQSNGLLGENGEAKKTLQSSSLWSEWSRRVEAVRTLRFTLEGNVVEDNGGSVVECIRHNANNCSCRDYLITDGDPAAMGYTIKEAVELSRSMVSLLPVNHEGIGVNCMLNQFRWYEVGCKLMVYYVEIVALIWVPGQRGIALQLLASVLDKALYELQQAQIGSTMRQANGKHAFVDWMAVWAYVLGPEPELAFSLRMALDSNHNSVVMACLKVIQSVLSCDINESFFNTSEKLATCRKSIYTAPVFRSRPEIDLGFLHGGFWKYSTKPSNILISDNAVMDNEDEGKHTIRDDLSVAGQDFAAGLVRMEILPRIRYLLEWDAYGKIHYGEGLEAGFHVETEDGEHLSHSCFWNFVVIESNVQEMDLNILPLKPIETDPTVALAECLISVLIGLARHSPTCAGAIFECPGLVQIIADWFANRKDTMEIYPPNIKYVTLLKVLAQSHRKICIDFVEKGIFKTIMSHFYHHKLSLGDWIESRREYYFYPALYLWLSPPTFDKLVENNLLGEFTSISREAYLVLEALVRKLPDSCSKVEVKQQKAVFAEGNMEQWGWSHASHIIELALKWMSFKNDLYLSKFTKKIVQDDGSSLHGIGVNVQLLFGDIFEVGIALIRNKFLNFSGKNDKATSQGESLIAELCHMRLHSDYDVAISSTCCLHWFVQLVIFLDKFFQTAKRENCCLVNGDCFPQECRILEDGIITSSQNELRDVLIPFMTSLSTKGHRIDTVETFGRGGPSPGVGVGWGAAGGGFWSRNILLEQTEAWLVMGLLEVFQVLDVDTLLIENKSYTLLMVNTALRVCLLAAPRERIIVESTLNILLQSPILKYLELLVHHLLISKGINPFVWKYKEEDFQCFCKNLNSHFKKRWLSSKKSKVMDRNPKSDPKLKVGNALETIYEDVDASDMNLNDQLCSSLTEEWTRQRLPLPVHWFLSPLSTIGHSIVALADEALEDARSGIFFLLGLEAISFFSFAEGQKSPVHDVPLVWKLHSLSAALVSAMGLLQEDKSRNIYETLQELYGRDIDESLNTGGSKSSLVKNGGLLAEGGKEYHVEHLKFKSDIHDSYSTFLEHLIGEFGAVSYGDVIYSRQVAMYLRSSVEVAVRLAAWNALSNGHLLELLPPLEKCFASPEGYLANEDNGEILGAYVKSWISGALDKAAYQGSMAFTLALHHLSSFIFYNDADDKALLRNKLAKSLLRDYSQKSHHEGMSYRYGLEYCENANSGFLWRYAKQKMKSRNISYISFRIFALLIYEEALAEMLLKFILYNTALSHQERGRKEAPTLLIDETQRRFQLLAEACEVNSTLLAVVEKLKSSAGLSTS